MIVYCMSVPVRCACTCGCVLVGLFVFLGECGGVVLYTPGVCKDW